MGEMNFSPILSFTLACEQADNFIKDNANFFMAFPLSWQICFFKYFGLPTKTHESFTPHTLLKSVILNVNLCAFYIFCQLCTYLFFTQSLYSFRIDSILLHSVFRGLLYALQQHLFYQHFLQHLLHMTTAAIWFHLEEYHIMYGRVVIAYLFAKYILLWKISSVAICGTKQCYFLFTFSTVDSSKKETMKIVYCPLHN